jgi:hypothetical protein
MRHLLEQQGVPPAQIWTEERSGSTFEKAVYSARPPVRGIVAYWSTLIPRKEISTRVEVVRV